MEIDISGAEDFTNANIANYNRYTGGVVGEVSYGFYGTDTSLGNSHTSRILPLTHRLRFPAFGVPSAVE